MRDDELKKLFSNTEEIRPSQQARDRALRAALDEFEATEVEEIKPARKNIFQGFWQRLRPTVETTTDTRSRPMKNQCEHFNNRKWQYTGIATASVLAVAVMIAYQKPQEVFTGGELVDPKSLIELADKAELEEVIASQPVATKRPTTESYSVKSKDEFRGEQGRREADMATGQEPARQDYLAKRNASNEALVGTLQQGAPMSIVPQPKVDQIIQPGYKEVGRDRFQQVNENPVKSVAVEPVSTFSIDVDTASYSFVRRQLNQGKLPQKNAVRIEEMVNYFDYAYPLPESRNVPFSTSVNVVDSPWKPGNKLIHIGIKGYELPTTELPRSNLVFLLDVSGSMNSPDKLPLVKQSMALLLSQLNPEDTVAIAVYAGAAGAVLEATPAKEKSKILSALNRLQAGGSTAGAQGLQLAYQLAESSYDKNAVNRIILATDGDFNLGITSRDELKGFVERKREEGIYLSLLGFGQGNYHDHLMQVLAQNGNGVAAYIDTLGEAQKVLVKEATSTLFPIAKDVKIQLEFNPATVSEYRLLGYETRHLENEDFNNDKVDAGDIGAGHTVTAIYEITPAGANSGLLPDSRYAKAEIAVADKHNEYGFLKLRYKLPEETVSKLITQPITTDPLKYSNDEAEFSRETGFASAVAGFAQLLKGGQYTGNWNFDDALNLAQQNKGEDLYGYRTELVQLIRKAKTAADM